MALEEGEAVLCTVDRIVGTVVFVKIDGEEREGSIILSEIAPGRIRNLREYVIPKKRIVCKVLKITGGTISLSLRRVSQKERKEVLEESKQEKSCESIIKNLFKENSEEILEKIKKQGKIYDCLEEAKKNPKKLEEILGKDKIKKILEMALKQKKKKKIIKKTIYLKTPEPNGLYLLKTLLEDSGNIEITYISAGKYSLKIETEDGKKGEQELKNFIEKIEKKSREKGVQFEFKEK